VTQPERTVATWDQLQVEIPQLLALTGSNVAELEQLLERLRIGQLRLEEARATKRPTDKIEALLEEIRAMVRERDYLWRRLALIRGMLLLRNLAGDRTSTVTVTAFDMEITGTPEPAS
jgi:hypothetical protein